MTTVIISLIARGEREGAKKIPGIAGMTTPPRQQSDRNFPEINFNSLQLKMQDNPSECLDRFQKKIITLLNRKTKEKVVEKSQRYGGEICRTYPAETGVPTFSYTPPPRLFSLPSLGRGSFPAKDANNLLIKSPFADKEKEENCSD